MAELTYFSTFFVVYSKKYIREKLCIKKKCLTFVKSKGLTLWLFRF